MAVRHRQEVPFSTSMCGTRGPNHLKISISIRCLSDQSVSDPGGRWVRTDVTRCGLDAVASYTVSHRGTFIYKLLLRMHCWEWRELYGAQGPLRRDGTGKEAQHSGEPCLPPHSRQLTANVNAASP